MASPDTWVSDAAPGPVPQLPQLLLVHPLPVLRLTKRHPRHGAGGIPPGAEPDLLRHGHLGALDAAQGLVLAREVDGGPLALADTSVPDLRPHGDGTHAAVTAEVLAVVPVAQIVTATATVTVNSSNSNIRSGSIMKRNNIRSSDSTLPVSVITFL